MGLLLLDQPQDDNFSPDQVAGLDLRGLYQKADKALGGWLPGGGTANPLSKPIRDAVRTLSRPPVATVKEPSKPFTPIKGAKRDQPAVDANGNLTREGKEVLRQLGITASVTNKLGETNPLAQIGAQHFGYINAAHANPFKNQIFIPNSDLNTLGVLAHEAGHLDSSRRNNKRPITEGILGQAINMPAAALKRATGSELSPFAQLLAPLRILGGGVTAYSDAREEDYAEKYAESAMRGMTGSTSGLGGISHAGTSSTASQYSTGLHSIGVDSMKEGVADLLIPSVAKAAASAANQVSRAMQPREKAGPYLNTGLSKQKLQLLWIEAEVDLRTEMEQNPNSRLIPRLKQIRDGYAEQLAAMD